MTVAGDARTRESLLERIALRAGGRRSAIIEPGGAAVSSDDLVRRTRAVAHALRARGLRVGDAVLFSVRPSVAAIELILAIHEAGGVIVPIDPRMGDALFASRVAELTPRWVVAESILLAARAPWLRRLLRWRGVRLAPLGALRGVEFVRVGPSLPGLPRSVPFAALERDTRPIPATEEPPDDSAPAFIVFTSGTTGTPKAVVHTRRSLHAILASVEGEMEIGPDDVLYARDLHLILPALVAGAQAVVPRRTTFDAARAIAEMEKVGAMQLFAVTGDCRALLNHCIVTGRRLPPTLRRILIGGAPAHASFLERFRDVLSPRTRVWCIYGMSEILPVARVSLEDKLAYAGEGDLVGTLVPGVGARLAGDGELLVRGEGLFARYLGGPPVEEHATGDLARISDGRVALIGRKKDMIIRGDFNLYPGLYEPTIERIPGVARCAFVGVYDEAAADERVVLVVEAMAGADAEALKRRVHRAIRDGEWRIDGAALPDEIVLMPLPESGRSSKVDKLALRKLVRERLARE